MPRSLDLDAARREAGQEPVTLTLHGATFDLPPSLPMKVVMDLSSLAGLKSDDAAEVAGAWEKVSAAMGTLIGEAAWNDMLEGRNPAHTPVGMSDVMAIIEGLPVAYGIAEDVPGEPSASAS